METVKPAAAFCVAKNIVLGHEKGKPLHVSDGGVPVPISFTLPAGQITAVVGPNGAGKSTLLNAFLNEPPLIGGSLFVNSLPQTIQDTSVRTLSEIMAVVTQESTYPEDLLLVDLWRLAYLNKVGVWGRLPSRESEVFRTYFGRFKLADKALKPLRRLSTGERQKAFLALALLQEPQVLLLDEPTNHLDPPSTQDFWEALSQQQHERPIDVLVSTHDLSFVRKYADHVLALKEGKLEYEGIAEGFLTNSWFERVYGKAID